MPLPMRNCVECGAEFRPSQTRAILCGDGCRAVRMRRQQVAWSEANKARFAEQRNERRHDPRLAESITSGELRIRTEPRPPRSVAQPVEVLAPPTPRRDKLSRCRWRTTKARTIATWMSRRFGFANLGTNKDLAAGDVAPTCVLFGCA